MSRNTQSWRYDYPKSDETSLSEISRRVLGKDYIETTKSEENKIKKIFRELNK